MPTSQGFDVFRGLGSGDGDYHTHVDRSGNPDWWRDNQLEPDEGYTTELLTRYSIDFITSHESKPFFLYLPHLAIHFPWQGPDDPPHRRQGRSYHDDKWGIIPEPGNVAPHVGAMIRSLDQSVGAIVKTLQRLDLDRRTMVIFTSDNGGYLSYGGRFRNISSNGVLRGQKTELYEGGQRVPMIISWPGTIRPTVTTALGHSVDLLPTIAALAGVDAGTLQTDGVDLGPHLFGGQPLNNRMLYWRAGPQAAVRSGPWKLYRKGQRTELYHLGDDLGETQDLSGRYPERVQQLNAAWNRWERDVNQSAMQYEESTNDADRP